MEFELEFWARLNVENSGNLNAFWADDASICTRICLTIRGIYEKFSKIIRFILLRES